MRNSAVVLLFLFCAAFLVAEPARAGKNDDAWAQCLWAEAPKSASNWIAMTPTKADALGSKDPYSLLAVRLEGICREKLIPPGKKYAPDFKSKSVRESLMATKPTVVGSDVAVSNAIRCEFFEEDEMLGMTIGYGDPSKLQTRPPVTSLKCQRINDDGTLTDA